MPAQVLKGIGAHHSHWSHGESVVEQGLELGFIRTRWCAGNTQYAILPVPGAVREEETKPATPSGDFPLCRMPS